jgi:FkbM family methyltransferase
VAAIHQIRAFLKKLGLTRRGAGAKREARQLLRGFAAFEIDLVLDVGANTGQFGQLLRRNGFAGRIVSFEPLSEAHRALREAAAKDPLWKVHDRCALGREDGSTIIHIARNSVSSSLLPMADTHALAAPDSAYVGQESVPLFRLDTVAQPYLESAKRPFLKMDTQGSEWDVLSGSERTLPHVHGVLCELSLVKLYDGEHLWRETIDRLESAGFTVWGFQPHFMDRTGRNLQVDAIFFRA